MCDKILNLPCSTSPAVHRSVLDPQNFSKRNNEDTIDGQESDGEVIHENKNDRTEIMPVQKNDKNAKDHGIISSCKVN